MHQFQPFLMAEINQPNAESSDEFSDDASVDTQEHFVSQDSQAKIKKARIERAKKNANIWTNYEKSVSLTLYDIQFRLYSYFSICIY